MIDDEESTVTAKLLENPAQAANPPNEKPPPKKEEFVRRTTFSRTLTFTPEAYQRAIVQPLEGLQRTFTEIGNRLDPDAQYTNALIDQYQKNNSGNEGDLPLQTGFARKSKFWKVVLLLTAVSAFMGLVAAGFMNATEKVCSQFLFRSMFFPIDLNLFPFVVDTKTLRYLRLRVRQALR
jgi:hypothetical protein